MSQLSRVHNKLVWGIIQHDWNVAATRNPATAAAYLGRLHETWVRILNQGQTAAGAAKEGFPGAEDHAYAPLFTASTGYKHVHGTKYWVYGGIQPLVIRTGFERAIRTDNTNYPPVPPSGPIRSWSDAGARNGRHDFTRLSSGRKFRTVDACKALVGTATGILDPLISHIDRAVKGIHSEKPVYMCSSSKFSLDSSCNVSH